MLIVDARASAAEPAPPIGVTAMAEQRLIPYREAVLAICRVDLPMTIDWASFDTASEPPRQTNLGLVAWSCSRVHDTLVNVCADPLRRHAVATTLKRLRCRGSLEADAWSLRDGELVVEIRSDGAFSRGGTNPLELWLETVL